MALFRTLSAALFGIDAHLIDVEVDMYPSGNQREIITGVVGTTPDIAIMRAGSGSKAR